VPPPPKGRPRGGSGRIRTGTYPVPVEIKRGSICPFFVFRPVRRSDPRVRISLRNLYRNPVKIFPT
jgi:hypothetical protein